jgi:K+-sensing histidine kinase KdpD
VAIAVPGDPERAREVLSRGRRIARYFGLEWVAVRIIPTNGERDAGERRSGDGGAGAEAAPRDLRELVAALGGRLLCAEAHDIAAGLVELSRREHARVLVIGRSRRPWFLRRLRRGVTERILRAKRPFDVIVAAGGVDR